MASSRKYLLSTLWASDIKTRDGNKCIICGSEEMLQVHHIYGVKDYGFLFSDTSNGVTLCDNCHKKYHQLYQEEVNPYTWTKFILNSQWNASSIVIRYNNGFTQEYPLYNQENNGIKNPKHLKCGDLRSTIMYVIQTSGFDKGVTPIDWVKLYVNQVYGVKMTLIKEELTSLIHH